MSLCTKRCAGCEYGFAAYDWEGNKAPACEYILRKGKPRPCPAGAHCAEYKPATDKRNRFRDRYIRGEIVW